MREMKSYYVALFATLALSIGIQMAIPFPYGMLAVVSIFLAWPLILRYKVMGKMVSNRGFSPDFKYGKVCLVCHCGTKGDTCPRCGSHQFGYK